jgi:uncharacterized membrane protein YgcG
MKFLFAALVGLTLFAANAAAQYQQCGPDCTCGPNCSCTTPILHQPPKQAPSELVAPTTAYEWFRSTNHPGEFGLFKAGTDEQVGEMYPDGTYRALTAPGRLAKETSKPPIPFPTNRFASESMSGSCGVGGCGVSGFQSGSFQGGAFMSGGGSCGAGGCSSGSCGSSAAGGRGFRGRR